MAVPDGWVRLRDLAAAELDAETKIALLAVAMEELAIAESLKLIHGERWQEVYRQVGGCVRVDDEGDPCIPIQAAARAGKGLRL